MLIYNYVYYPDGSAKWGVGAGVYVRWTGHTPEQGEAEILKRAADPFESEQHALCLVLRDAKKREGPVWIFTDSHNAHVQLLIS